jgi:hypothetical protein
LTTAQGAPTKNAKQLKPSVVPEKPQKNGQKSVPKKKPAEKPAPKAKPGTNKPSSPGKKSKTPMPKPVKKK